MAQNIPNLIKNGLDGWDSYVRTVKDMGIEDVLAVYRTQYERMNAE